MKAKSFLRSSIGAAAFVAFAGPASAVTVVDLTTAGAIDTANGATFVQTSDQSTGTGVINPFLRLQATGTEAGLNTDANANFVYDDKAGIWTHALDFSDVALDADGNYRFFLDINQVNSIDRQTGHNNALLTLNEIKLYRDDSATRTSIDDFAAGQLLWDLDGAGDASVELNYGLNPGSGAGDMYFTVAESTLTAGSGKYLYLYSSFGNANGSNDGFEEWSTATLTAPIPEPETYALMLAGLAAVGFMARRRRQS